MPLDAMPSLGMCPRACHTPPPPALCSRSLPVCCTPDDAALSELVAWTSAACIVLIAADELEHETAQRDREQRGLLPGHARRVLPIALAVTNPAAGLYVRLHRRHGTADRFLAEEEIQVN